MKAYTGLRVDLEKYAEAHRLWRECRRGPSEEYVQRMRAVEKTRATLTRLLSAHPGRALLWRGLAFVAVKTRSGYRLRHYRIERA